MEKKALFLDMDGTTLNDQVEIPKENLEAMKAALKAGHEIVVTTGRPTASTRKLLEQWGLDKIGCRYVISFNGGMVLDAISGDIIYEKTIPVEWMKLVAHEAKQRGVYVHTYEGNHVLSGQDGEEYRSYVKRLRMEGRLVSDLEESIEVVIAGYQKKNAVLSDQEKKVVAYHEIGHALVAAMQTHSAPVQKITIIPRTSGALGYTMQVEQGDKYLLTKQELENKIATFTGGRAAEEVVFGEITTGASNDIEQATKIARAMITRYGMSDDFDMVAMETVTNQYLGGDASLACSADTQNEIDRKVVELVKREHEKAKKILLDNRQKLDELSNYLYEKETITGDEFMAILNGEAKKETNTETKIESGAEKKEADADEQTI